MAVPSSSPAKHNGSTAQKRKDSNSNNNVNQDNGDAAHQKQTQTQQPKRSKNPGVRVVGGRIYCPINGKTCHQCRQKTLDFSAACKNMKGDKQCTIRFCHKCLLNRYGENAADVSALDDWNCPKCRGICNCSCCMKKRGQNPTGILVHTAKKTGFSSVSEMLCVNSPEKAGNDRTVKHDNPIPKNSPASTKKPKHSSPHILDKENPCGQIDQHKDIHISKANSDKKSAKKRTREGLKEICNGNGVDDNSHLTKSTRKSPRLYKKVLNDEEDHGRKRKDGSPLKAKKKLKLEVVGNLTLGSAEKGQNPNNDVAGISDATASKSVRSDKVGEKNEKAAEPTIMDGSTESHVTELPVNKAVKKKKKVAEPTMVDGSTESHVTELPVNKAVKKKKKVAEPTMVDGSTEGHLNELPVNKVGKKKKKAAEQTIGNQFTQSNRIELPVEIPLPEGTPLNIVAGIELTEDYVGDALQFLEFCAAFRKVLGLKKQEAEIILQELICGKKTRYSATSSTVIRFHIKLLSLILKDLGEKSSSLSLTDGSSWLKALEKYVSEYECESRGYPLECLDFKFDSYGSLNCLQKLKLLNFLCDEVLCTERFRSWIEEENSKYIQNSKEARQKLHEAKDKKKLLKQKLQGEVAQAIIAKNGVPLSIEEHEAIVSQVKHEIAQAQSQWLELTKTTKEHRFDAVRTEPILFDDKNHAFWKLKIYSGGQDILLQDVSSFESDKSKEKWIYFDAEKKDAIDSYISQSIVRKPRVSKVNT